MVQWHRIHVNEGSNYWARRVVSVITGCGYPKVFHFVVSTKLSSSVPHWKFTLLSTLLLLAFHILCPIALVTLLALMRAFMIFVFIFTLKLLARFWYFCKLSVPFISLIFFFSCNNVVFVVWNNLFLKWEADGWKQQVRKRC